MEMKVRNPGIDETSCRKRHGYATVVTDKEWGESTPEVISGYEAGGLKEWFRTQRAVI
jgi:hypothetical protein